MDEPAIASLARTMLVLDPPDHTRLRGLVTKAFTARRVADMRPRIQALVDEQLDRVIDKGEMDVMRDLAHRLPVIVICDMLGIPEDHRAPFLAGSNVNGRILEPVPMTPRGARPGQPQHPDGAASISTSSASCAAASRRTTSPPSWCGPRRRATSSRPRSCEANIGLLFGAGHETTTNLIGNGLLALHRQPDQWERLKADPSLIPNADRGAAALRFLGADDRPRHQRRGRDRRRHAAAGRERHHAAGRGQPRSGAVSRSRQARCRPPEHPADVVRRRHPSLPGRPARAARGRAGLHRAGRAPAQPRTCRRRTRRPGGAASPCAGCSKLPAVWH